MRQAGTRECNDLKTALRMFDFQAPRSLGQTGHGEHRERKQRHGRDDRSNDDRIRQSAARSKCRRRKEPQLKGRMRERTAMLRLATKQLIAPRRTERHRNFDGIRTRDTGSRDQCAIDRQLGTGHFGRVGADECAQMRSGIARSDRAQFALQIRREHEEHTFTNGSIALS